MKHFAQSITINDRQQEVSRLLTNMNESLKSIEDSGGAVQQLYVAHSNPHDPQTTTTVYFAGDGPDGLGDDIENRVFEGAGNSATEAYIAANKLLVDWLENTKITDILDIKFDFYVGEDGDDIAVANVFYASNEN